MKLFAKRCGMLSTVGEAALRSKTTTQNERRLRSFDCTKLFKITFAIDSPSKRISIDTLNTFFVVLHPQRRETKEKCHSEYLRVLRVKCSSAAVGQRRPWGYISTQNFLKNSTKLFLLSLLSFCFINLTASLIRCISLGGGGGRTLDFRAGAGAPSDACGLRRLKM